MTTATDDRTERLLNEALDRSALDDHTGALALLNMALDTTTTGKPSVLLARADVLRAMGRDDEARADILAVLDDIESLDTEEWAVLVSALDEAGEIPGQRRRLWATLDAATESSADDPFVYVARGELARCLGLHGNASNEFSYATEIDPDMIEAWRGLAESDSAAGWHLDAATAYDRAADLDPNDIVLFARLGDALLAAGDATAAIHAFEEGLELAPGDEALIRGRARSSLELNLHSDALEDVEVLLERGSTSAADRLLAGRALYGLGRDAESVDVYDKVLAADGNNVDALRYRGDVRYSMRDLAGAEQDYVAVLQADPKDADTWLGLAETRFERGDVDGALEAATKAEAIDSKIPEAHLIVSRVKRLAGDLDGAREALDAAIEKAPDSGIVYLDRARLLHATGWLNLAWRDARWAIDINPESFEAHFLRGVLALEIEGPLLALEDFDESLSIHPEFGPAYAWRGRAFQIAGDLDKAEGDWREASKFLPETDPLLAQISEWRREPSPDA